MDCTIRKPRGYYHGLFLLLLINKVLVIERLPAKRAYISFLADFFIFLQDQANFWQTDLC